jgi:hypothetical protein
LGSLDDLQPFWWSLILFSADFGQFYHAAVLPEAIEAAHVLVTAQPPQEESDLSILPAERRGLSHGSRDIRLSQLSDSAGIPDATLHLRKPRVQLQPLSVQRRQPLLYWDLN